jgi:hypothetical protein
MTGRSGGGRFHGQGQVQVLLAQLLGDREVVAFRQRLARSLGALPALFLSQACYWQGVAGPGAWWFKNRLAQRDDQGVMLPPSADKQSWEWELGMTRSEQESARKVLVELKLLEEQLADIPARLHFRVNLEELEQFLLKNQQMAGSCQQEGEIGPPTRSNPATKPAGFEPTNTNTSSENTTQTTTTCSEEKSGGVVLDELVYEPSINRYRGQLFKIIQEGTNIAPELAQDLLDELAGTIEAAQRGDRQKIASPVAWMREIVERAKNGRFDRLFCFRVQERRAIQRHRSREQEIAPPSDPEIARQHLDQLLDRMKPKNDDRKNE